MKKRFKILVFSCNDTHWGGSEELWARTAVALAEAGCEVTVVKPNINWTHPVIKRLRECSRRQIDIASFPFLPKSMYKLFLKTARPLAQIWQGGYLSWLTRITRPDLVILSQGGNWDGFGYASLLKRFCKNYVLICQKATELYWPSDWMRPYCKDMYSQALAAYFVSQHNWNLTEQQLGMLIPIGKVVRNPYLVSWDAPVKWPSNDGILKFACVGRFFPMEKGQDILLRVLSKKKWRERPITVDFFGEGDRLQGLKDLANFLELKNVSFPGFSPNVNVIWETHHALLLPTRAEGLPLVLVEAMLAGRVAIVTNVAGNTEVCSDGTTGFIASAATEDAFDEAMERAWTERDAWQAIGQRAADAIRRQVPKNPPAELADDILKLSRAHFPERSVPHSALSVQRGIG